ncbi:uncharacterized protein A4U43_C07F8730 [Asparagus officinalis]|uniref:RNA exonuclease 4 n=1 Tax=Asparagus officinalis TaxID=4686 RepID=A0A5P1EAD1_ASPOF|nr:uncharacterized protein LOC109848142 isoform X2 [Asparagus officinalis]ONK62846.1 uncharacterized protein A4U43_C07F8730 [Asparagus officinalis]
MEPQAEIPKSSRHKCSACFKQYKIKDHLVEHMKKSYHSVHQPKCGVCKKHCKTLESVREHLTGPLAKSDCAVVFAALGCKLCLSIFDNVDARGLHEVSCSFDPPSVPELMSLPIADMCDEVEAAVLNSAVPDDNGTCPKLVALDCEMVGGGDYGSFNLCGRVCLVNEKEEVIFHAYVKPIIPITDYRYELTGITEDHIVDATPICEVSKRVKEILYNGEESTWRMRTDGGEACLLIGHDLDHDLEVLRMDYPENLTRDTAKYRPLLKTNLKSHSLKYLTKTYLGYEIQSGTHNPYEDAVSAMRLYKRIRSIVHQTNEISIQDNDDSIYYTNDSKKNSPFDSNKNNKKKSPFDLYKKCELLAKSPDELLEISKSSYKCWCWDAKRTLNRMIEE